MKLKRYLESIEIDSDRKILQKAIKKHGVKVRIVSEKDRLIELTYKNKKRLMLGDRFYFNITSSIRIAKSKRITRDILEENKISVPRGIVSKNISTAVSEVKRKKMKYPLVVKPVDGSKSEGVIMDINSEKELKKGIRKMKRQCKMKDDEFLVEETAKGKNFRLLLLGGKFVACAQRTRAHVIGDGKSSIKKLIEQHNKNAIKKFRIVIDKEALSKLGKQKLKLKSVLEKGRRADLRDVASLSTGGVSIDRTQETSPYFKKIGEQIASIFNLKRIGIDVMAEDITSNTSPSYAVLEINCDPGITFHEKPIAQGKGVDTVKSLLDTYFKN